MMWPMHWKTGKRSRSGSSQFFPGLDVEIVDIDWLNEEGLLIDIEDVRKVEEHFKQKKVDAVFMPHCNFGSEEVVGKLGKVMGNHFFCGDQGMRRRRRKEVSGRPILSADCLQAVRLF